MGLFSSFKNKGINKAAKKLADKFSGEILAKVTASFAGRQATEDLVKDFIKDAATALLKEQAAQHIPGALAGQSEAIIATAVDIVVDVVYKQVKGQLGL